MPVESFLSRHRAPAEPPFDGARLSQVTGALGWDETERARGLERSTVASAKCLSGLNLRVEEAMKARKVMRLEVTTVPLELSVEQAHTLMLKLGVRHLPVVSEHKLAGILSDRDVLLACTRNADGTFLYPSLTVGEVMTLSPEVAGPDVHVAQLAQAMVEGKIDALPIVSKDNELLGLVTSTDLMLLLTEMPSETEPMLSYQIRRVDTLPTRA